MTEKIIELIGNINVRPLIIAIDGMSASGKTTLAAVLGQALGAPVIHTDDFFIPRKSRTGNEDINIDINRFLREVIEPLSRGHALCYGVFDCMTQKITRYEKVCPCEIYIIEGAYCLHPSMPQVATLKVFMQISADEQKARITTRNGAQGYIAFRDRWIPFENSYFEKYKIKERCDIVL